MISKSYLSLYLKRKKCLIISIIGTVFSVTVYSIVSKLVQPRMALVILVICTNAVVIPAILAIVGYGRRFLTKHNWLLKKLNAHSFYIYILHQPILIACAYYVLPLSIPGYLKVTIILVVSFIITVIACYILSLILNIYTIGINKVSTLITSVSTESK